MLSDIKKFLERSRTTDDLIAREEYETAIMLTLEGVAQLEAKLAAHLENEGDECPLCKLEAEKGVLMIEKAVLIKDLSEVRATNRALLRLLDEANAEISALLQTLPPDVEK